jgi:hypothetical protein
MVSPDATKPPAPWSIDRGGPDDGDLLRIGERRLRLGDVRNYESGASAEITSDGHMLAVGIFFAAGALLVLPVAMQLLHPRFLAGGLLFIGIGLMAVADILQGKRLIVHRVWIRMADGSTEIFASPHAEECRWLVAALDDRASPRAA